MVKLLLKKCFMKIYCNFKFIQVDLLSNISLKTIKNLKSEKKYPIIIRNAEIGGDVRAKYGCEFFDCKIYGESDIELGKFVSIDGPGTKILTRIYGISIGSFTSIARNVTIQEDNHNCDRYTTYFANKNVFKENYGDDIISKGKIIIEEDVWIGANAVILSGVKIGRGAVVGAGSIVTKDVKPYSIVVGNPAKCAKMRFSQEKIEYLEKSKWWLMNEEQIKEFSKKCDHKWKEMN